MTRILLMSHGNQSSEFRRIFFGGLLRKKSLEEIFFKMLPMARNLFKFCLSSV